MEIGYWVRSCRFTLQDRFRNIIIRQRMDIGTSIIDTINAYILRWYGHVYRKEGNRWPEMISDWIPPQRRN